MVLISSDNKKVVHEKEILIGEIAVGETRDIKVPVKASLDLETGAIRFEITCNEKRGYDCKKYQLNVQTAKLENPDLSIVSYKLNDGQTGLANGNGNGIPENGETIEIIPVVKNNGVGDAFKVDLAIASISSGVEIKTRNATIAEIKPGQAVSGNLSFYIPTTYAGKGIDLNLTATDVRGVAKAQKQYALTAEINRPNLSYSYTILGQKGQARRDLQNGEYGELEIKAANRGQLEARNVSVALSSTSLSFSKSREEILRLGANSEYAPIRFPFQVPKVMDKNSVKVQVSLNQKDFPGIEDIINIPIKLVRPEFKITHQLLDQNQNGILEQGESADLLVRVENTGLLDADNVTLSMNLTQKGVAINGPKEVTIGRIEAGKSSDPKRFSIFVQRAAEVGALPIQFTVTEQSFGTSNLALNLNIGKEQAEVITVQGQERVKPAAPMVAQASQPPNVLIGAPNDQVRVASEAIILTGSATSERGISQIEVQVNGRRINLDERGLKVRTQGPDQRKRNFNFNIPLQSGENRITVTAYNMENLSGSDTITVHREAKKGEIWAAVIGINQYKNPKLTLKYARNDAQA